MDRPGVLLIESCSLDTYPPAATARPVTCWAVEVTLATRRVSEAVRMMAWPVTSRAVFALASEPGADRPDAGSGAAKGALPAVPLPWLAAPSAPDESRKSRWRRPSSRPAEGRCRTARL